MLTLESMAQTTPPRSSVSDSGSGFSANKLKLKTSKLSPLRLESIIHVSSPSSPRTPRTSSLRPTMEPITEAIEPEDTDPTTPVTNISPLLSLPQELRLQIWEYVLSTPSSLGVQTYTLPLPPRSSRYSFPPPPTTETTRLGLTGFRGEFIPCTLCRKVSPGEECPMPRSWHLRLDDFSKPWGRRKRSFRLHLLLVCRSIYSETHPLLYTHSPLSFQTFTIFTTWLQSALPASLTTPHLQSFSPRRLIIGYGPAYFSHLYRSTSSFGQAFRAITQMPDLESLTLILTTDWIAKTGGEKVAGALMLGEFKGWMPRRRERDLKGVGMGRARDERRDSGTDESERELDGEVALSQEVKECGFVVRIPEWEADGRKRAVIQRGLWEEGLLCRVERL